MVVGCKHFYYILAYPTLGFQSFPKFSRRRLIALIRFDYLLKKVFKFLYVTTKFKFLDFLGWLKCLFPVMTSERSLFYLYKKKGNLSTFFLYDKQRYAPVEKLATIFEISNTNGKK